MTSSKGEELVVITRGDLKELISDAIEEKLADFAEMLKESPAPSDSWQKVYDFCSTNHMSRSNLFRMIKEGKIEVMELSARNKLYRWKSE